jgi:hypothetical protein
MPSIDNTSHAILERSVAELNLDALVLAHRTANPSQPYRPSPASWADQVLYFLMVDRFSNGLERGTATSAAGVSRNTYLDNDGNPVVGGATDLFRFPDNANSVGLDSWRAAGGQFCGGTLRGIRGKLGYVKRIGASAIWISPVLKQVASTFDALNAQLIAANNYHGYATQNFLDRSPLRHPPGLAGPRG